MESRSCHLAPKTVSFHYLSLPSNPKTPATLFRMATAAAPGRTGPDSLRFGIVGGNSRGIFVMQRSDRQTGELILVQSLRGPQEVSVDVDMSEYSDRTFQAKHVAKVHVLVSPYTFWKQQLSRTKGRVEKWNKSVERPLPLLGMLVIRNLIGQIVFAVNLPERVASKYYDILTIKVSGKTH